jgi:hypothetical protein
MEKLRIESYLYCDNLFMDVWAADQRHCNEIRLSMDMNWFLLVIANAKNLQQIHSNQFL